MSKILHDIIQWVESLPYWEQAALDKIGACCCPELTIKQRPEGHRPGTTV